jgi:hypothetical protein
MQTVKRYGRLPRRHAFDRRRTNAVRSSIPLTNDRGSRRIECRRCWSRCSLGRCRDRSSLGRCRNRSSLDRCWNRSSLGRCRNRCSLGRWLIGHWWNRSPRGRRHCSNGYWWNDRCSTGSSVCRTRRTKLRMIWNDSNFRAD